MLFSKDGIKNIFYKQAWQEDKMVNPQGQEVILNRGGIKHTLKGAGISDSSVASKKFRGLADRAEQWNFVSLHINTVTTMGALGAIVFCLGMLLYYSSRDCWQSIRRVLNCCRCTMVP